ncbi:DUF3486 family protein [Salmonella enterica subsp. enterica serovar Poona]|nr:DUF3486 family protein [Salmonella enterica]EHK1092701.1 DUF3486 family protein [Salmonella enterica subsp. enterica serovar Poona]ELE3234353.1 DUF3486 family protein [Salmonella enterica subsp. enterica serovar Pomona]EBN1281139.1 DUF3486 family protein [Salmonella enterica]EBR6994641.1 DUF3486 family protein [Salmonella enterica]
MPTEKQTRGRASKIDLLPAEIQRELNALLSDKRHSQADIRAAINELIDKAGLPDGMKLSRSGLNRYAADMETAGAKIREMNAIAEQWTGQIDIEKSGETSKILIQLVRSLAFDVMMKIQTGEGDIDPKGLKELATAIEKLEKSATESTKREREIRLQYAAEAAEAVKEELRGQDGMSEELERSIRRVLLGKA